MNEIEILESTSVDMDDEPLRYRLPNGNQVMIGKYDRSFFEQLQKLPVPTKIQMMELSDVEMQEYLDSKYNSANSFLIELLQKKWFFRETGDPAKLDADIMEIVLGIPMTPQQILKKCKSKKLSLKDINKLIAFYTKGTSDVYTK